VPNVDELDAVVARQLREVLDTEVMRREDFAQQMRQLGFRWTGNTITQVVTGRRALSLLEAAGVCAALGVPLADFLGAEGEVKLPNYDKGIPVGDITEALRTGSGSWGRRGLTAALFGSAQGEFEEADVKAAKRLSVSPAEIGQAAMHLWNRPLGAERDHRFPTDDLDFNAPENRRTLQARRGHATRALIEELRTYFDGRRGER
jgi:hypothetical protein